MLSFILPKKNFLYMAYKGNLTPNLLLGLHMLHLGFTVCQSMLSEKYFVLL